MKVAIENAEQNHAKNTEFRNHLNAAKVALDHDNASGAIDRLTKALIVDPANHEAQTMLKHARALYESNRQKAEFANAYSEAEYYFKKSSYDQALIAVRKALDIENDPTSNRNVRSGFRRRKRKKPTSNLSRKEFWLK